MTQHKPVLTNEDMHALICGNPSTLGLSIARLKDFIRQVEKAVIDKLAEQEPVVYRFLPPDTQQYMYITDDVPKIKEFEPLYAHPPMLTDHIPYAGQMINLSLSVDTKETQTLLQSYLDDLKDWQLVPREISYDMRRAVYFSTGIATMSELMPVLWEGLLDSAPKYTGNNDG